MNLNKLKFVINDNGNITKIEEQLLNDCYIDLFKEIYGYDILSEYLYEKPNIEDTIFWNDYLIESIDVLKSVKNNKNFSLIIIYNEEYKIIGFARLKQVEKNISVPDIAILNDYNEYKYDIWEKTILFIENYVRNLKYNKIYIEIPLNSPLLFKADDLGFIESPEDIPIIEKPRTRILNKYLNVNNNSNLILNINKEVDFTSRDVVNKLSKILNIKKIGHTGTLDPIASGVLVCVTGKYTKLVELITSLEKEYIAEIKLGIKTDTLDISGNVQEKCKVKKYTKEEIMNILESFIGEYEQIVPKYSAVKINGKKLYEYARNNEDIDLPKRKVTIKNIELLEYNNDLIKFKVLVSKGTYIRSLIQDICDKLNTIGTMNSLIRTKQGRFTINSSYTLDDIKNNNYKSLSLEEVLDLQIIKIDNNLYKKVINGNKINMDYDGYILFKKDNIDVALYYFENKIGCLKILF